MKKIIYLSILVILVNGCVTPNFYVKDKTGTRFGYSDYRVSDDVFVVSFRGHARCTYETVSKLALRRASEIAIENNFTHFVILEKFNDTKQGFVTTSSGTASAYSYGTTATAYGSGIGFGIPFSLPSVSFKIKFYKGKPVVEYPEIVEAEQFLNYNFPDWKVEKTKK